MDNEFGYIDNKPFKNCYPDDQIISIINTDENAIQFKINDTENQKSKVKSDFHATHSNLESSSCAKTILTKRSCSVGRSQTIQQDSCGSGRGVSRSSC